VNRKKCPQNREGGGHFSCRNYKNVYSLPTGFCKCPKELDGKDVSQCSGGKCVQCLNRKEKCDSSSGSDLKCCNFRENPKISMCVNGICDLCYPSNVDYYQPESKRCSVSCCDPKAKCQRGDNEYRSICKL